MTELFSVAGSRSVYDGKVMSVRVDEVVMPGGGTALREVVGHDRAVAVVALDTENTDETGEPSVVLIEQYRHPLRRRLWELPAGLMDVAGEAALIAAQRELTEETGYAATDWQLLIDSAASPGFTDEVVRVFLATGLYEVGRPEDPTDEEADLKVVRVPLSQAVQGIFDGAIVNSASITGILSARLALTGDYRLRDSEAPWADGVTGAGPDESVGDAPTLQ